MREPPQEAIVPRIRRVDTLLEIAGLTERSSDSLVYEPLVGELLVTYAFDLPAMFQLVALRALERLGIARNALRDIALKNLRRACGHRIELTYDGPFIEPRLGNHFESSTLADEPLWESLREEHGDLVVAVPTRDRVVACPIEETDAVGELALAAEALLRADPPGAITSDLLVWSGRWELLEAPDA